MRPVRNVSSENSGNFQFSIVYWHQPDSWSQNHQMVRQEGPVAEFQRKSLAATAYNIKRKKCAMNLSSWQSGLWL